ncbi:dienelactone hydrolase [Corallococcus sp. H22C18031201]|uniref:dienelactone hydrolase family protein n=1 Tax=Citreicoccus inhibens TaxID=2849499 RepID=UPI000E72AA17|nr:dienelactone hydrolase family protein [Citreicoccus inhibens]MBU8894834.1 dienelactone hydrolase family protein [Citreicoccus inhibens]RJS17680.1 dienelactone hydrolase [Corallococcus sp. H22C18031201]
MRILVLHSAYGLRPAVREAVQRLEAAGHTATAPDLYAGQTADALEHAIALRDAMGRQELLARAMAATEDFRPDAILGFSLGASLAQRVAVRRGAPLRLVLIHGAAENAERPHPGLRMVLHAAHGDPFVPDDELAVWTDSFVRAGADVTVHRYAGGGHLFTDPGLPDFHPASTARTWDNTLRWLAEAG